MLRDAVERLQRALSAEFDKLPKTCTLATADARGRPAARTVVCRRVLMTGDIYIFSDERADKISHLRENTAAEVVFWLSQRREQIRVRGAVATNAEPALRVAFWRELSGAARAMYAWPPPGTPRATDESLFPRELGAIDPPLDTFSVLILRPHAIEWLDLNPHPHDRRRWRADHDWQEERLNP